MRDGEKFRLEDPPVRFVQYAILIDDCALTLEQLARLIEKWRPRFPTVAPKKRPVEHLIALEGEKATRRAQIGGHIRVDFEDGECGNRIFLQADRLTRTWEIDPDSRDPATRYPGFEHLADDLKACLCDISEVSGEQMVTVGSEMAYFNRMSRTGPDQVIRWVTLADHGSGPDSPKTSPIMRSATYAGLRVHLVDEDRDRQLIIGVDEPVDEDEGTGQLVIISSGRTREDELGGLEDTHDALIAQFIAVTPSNERRAWGEG